jgi:hypothetical protein
MEVVRVKYGGEKPKKIEISKGKELNFGFD